MTNRNSATLLRRSSIVCSLGAIAVLSLACSSKEAPSTVGPPGGAAAAPGTTGGSGAVTGGSGPSTGGLSLGGSAGPGDGPGGPCQGLECAVPDCVGMPKTTISGKVYDPAGKVPLYNVLVYVPNGPVEPFTEGASCDRCDAKVLNPVTSAVTDESGSFVLTDAPAGQDVPLVIQVGKWRRQIKVPTVTGCADTPLTDPQVTRLPRNKAEGDIPRIAITTGSADQMECLPLRLGIDPAEFTTASGNGRIHLYSGDYGMRGNRRPLMAFDATLNNAEMLTPASTLWSTAESLLKYDIVVLSCESESFAQQKPMTSREAMYTYASKGGRVFASHWHNIWFADGPDPVPSTGSWEDRMPNPMGDTANPIMATINQTFPKGEALAKWLVNVGASTTLGQMDVTFSRDNLQSVNATVAREWITVDNPNFPEAPKAVQYMSFNAPIGAPEEMMCGRAVYTNLHVASVDNTTEINAQGFPASCELRDLSAQEKAVAFMLFDLSACVQNEDVPPKPPK